MRANVLPIVLCAGCSALADPAGQPQTWPPPLGVAIESVVAADLDGDAISEIVALSSGHAAEAGVYLIEGDRNLAAGATPHGFSEFASLPLLSPTVGAAFVAGGSPYVLAAFAQADQSALDLASFGAKLAPRGKPLVTGLIPGGTVLWVEPAVRTDGTIDLLVGNGARVQYVPGDSYDVPLATTLAPPIVAATTYQLGGVRMLAVANPTDVQTAILNVDGGVGSWTSLRTAGPTWLGQVAIDLDGDGRNELVGYDPALQEVCAIALGDGATSCITTGDDASIGPPTLLFANVQGGPEPDLVIVQSGSATAEVAVVQDVSFAGNALEGVPQGAVAPSVALGGARAVAASRGPGKTSAILLVDPAGHFDCTICN